MKILTRNDGILDERRKTLNERKKNVLFSNRLNENVFIFRLTNFVA